MFSSAGRIPHLHAVVLAGGSGARFWPLSRELSPKQMLDIFGGVSLITRAVRRIAPLLEPGSLHVLTNERLLDELRNHLIAQDGIEPGDIDFLAEPKPRNTAAAMALAAAYLAHRDPSAIMIALPSDHLLSDGEQWQRTVRLACEAAEGGALVTVGLKPTAPETGYGYIRSGRELPGLADGDIRVHTVAQFVEKPDPETAREYLADGRYLWNSGMLVACATTVLSQLRSVGRRQVTPESSHGEQIAETAEWLAQLPPEKWHDPEAIERFGALPAVQFDKAVLEISERVAVVPTELDWSDVGSLLSLACLEQPDERGNVLVGNVQDVDSSGVIAYSADRLVATLGLHDVVVVDTADATLVADKNRTQDVRAVVERLREAGAPELIANRESLRPWGSWTSLLKGDAYHIKSIVVRPGQRLSLQSHENRSEHWVVISGTAEVERDGEMFTVQANESAFIPSGSKHRLSNPGDEPLRVIEVAVGDYLEEDDIVRYDDDWGR